MIKKFVKTIHKNYKKHAEEPSLLKYCHSRKVNVAMCIWCIPNKSGLLLITRICMCHNATLSVNICIWCLRPRSDPLVCIGITRLQEKSLEQSTANSD